MLYPFLRPLFFSLDPEQAHHLTLKSLKLLQASLIAPVQPLSDPRLSQELWGLRFPNPVGLAAGYDKNAQVPLAWHALGFGFAELGTVTAKAQVGNPKPRIFRLEKDAALINRLGFNNDGAVAIARRLAKLLPPGRPHPIPLGFNIGKSRVTPLEEAVDDYVESCERLFPFADYLVVNVSSPNTPDLRKLQESERLGRLLEALLVSNRRLADQSHAQPKPVLVKIAPDLQDEEVTEVARVSQAVGASGLIATNTTIARPALRSLSREEGGLSGQPLAKRALEVLRVLFRAVDGKLPLIGVGGIFSAEDAYARIRAGASLVQLYTGLIYEGPLLPRRLVRGLRDILAEEGCEHLHEAVGKSV
ncbi:MAG TPA: quinone-dependent dihydroorotate dehydrogenase [Candidatus Binatia bacterium]|jgi:dihydroorotate dehydrogenase|nr:quinone-dependent dihydroorotate dehydrogenase [Candidatus Binatia bacterium]